MNKPGRWSALLSGLLLACVSGMSVADRGHGGHGHADVGVGIVVNPFWYDTWPGSYYSPYYYPPYYYPPAVVTVPVEPPVYIERDEEDSPTAPEASAYWYYCADPQGYYPYVKRCPGGWQAVAPQPAGEGEER